MKTLHFSLTVLVAALLFTSCNNDGSIMCRRPQGETVLTEYPAEAFDRIDLQMAADVIITQGEGFKVEAKAANNIHEILIANVSGNELTLRTQRGKCIRGNANVVFYVTCPDVVAITLSGSGDITSQGGFDGENLEVRISGSGDMDLQNFNYKDQSIAISGSGDLLLNNFYAIETELKTSGSGEIEMKNSVLTNVDVSITGSGKTILEGVDATYYSINISGSGRISAFDMPVSTADVKIGGSGNAELTVKEALKANITGSGSVLYYGNPNVDANITGSGKVKKLD